MSFYDNDRGGVESKASLEDLEVLLVDTQAWLINNGTTQMPPRAVMLGTHNGLPVSTDLISINFTASLEAILKHTPQAAADLRINGPLDLTFFTEQYEPLVDGGLQYVRPDIRYGLQREPVIQETDSDIVLIIRYGDDGEVEGSRLFPWRMPVEIDPKAFKEMDIVEKAMIQISGERLMQEHGIDFISTQEHSALAEIVSNLDAIKAFDEKHQAAA